MTGEIVAMAAPIEYRDLPRHQVTVLDPGCGWLNSNDRLHWRRRAYMTAAWREAAGWHAKDARLPMLKRAHVFAELGFADARRRDPMNWWPTVKACIDGIIAAGRLLPDDDDRHLVGPDIRLGVALGRGERLRVSLLVVDLSTQPRPPGAGVRP